MDTIFLISSGIYVAGIAISALLLYIYSKNYKHLKSGYCIGLMIFASLFLVDNIISLHQVLFSWPLFAGDVMSHILLQDVIDVVGLSALLYITLK